VLGRLWPVVVFVLSYVLLPDPVVVVVPFMLLFMPDPVVVLEPFIVPDPLILLESLALLFMPDPVVVLDPLTLVFVPEGDVVVVEPFIVPFMSVLFVELLGVTVLLGVTPLGLVVFVVVLGVVLVCAPAEPAVTITRRTPQTARVLFIVVPFLHCRLMKLDWVRRPDAVPDGGASMGGLRTLGATRRRLRKSRRGRTRRWESAGDRVKAGIRKV